MVKYQIVKEWDVERYVWRAYEIVAWWKQFTKGLPKKRYICCSLESAEDCESKLLKALAAEPPRVVRDLEI